MVSRRFVTTYVKPGGAEGMQTPHASLVEDHARLDERRLAGGTGGVEEVGGAVEARDRLEAIWVV